MPAMDQFEHYRYLGVPIGMVRDVTSLESLVDDLCGDLDKIHKSLLAPWQKLDAIRTFVQPCLTFALRAGEPLKASLIKYHVMVRYLCVKYIFQLGIFSTFRLRVQIILTLP
jgi:hypothetical protein